jgi:hypothetical protein
MKDLYKEIERPLSGKEIKDFIPHCSIITYPDLYQYDNLESLFQNKNTDCIIILYETNHNYGHWTMLIDKPDRITFFDSYNNQPDEQFSFIPKNFKLENDMIYGYLIQLLLNSDKEIHYNNYKLQSKSKNISTCGRHCIVRYMYKYLDDDDYYDMLNFVSSKSGFSFDEIVTIKTL